ncbi:MAG: sterol desaturase family protein [Isosphaeraceae bacterium]|nr:sterol desaturase family protein [Isosphaeraceae bacterium]
MTLRKVILRALSETWEFAFGGFVWYAALAGIVWLCFYALFRRRAQARKINPRPPGRGQVPFEIRQSLLSLLAFGLTSGATVFIRWGGLRTRLYQPIDRHGWEWFAASIVLCIVIHDAYFYWTHRLMHHPRLFRRVHRTHHLSGNPTPWAAYSFSIPEAFVQAGIGPLLVYTVPMHYSAFLFFMTWQIAFNVFGHSGYEIFPRWFLGTWAGKFLNTPTHHALHHEKVVANFGLYFNVWDRLCGTNHPDYEGRFAAVTTRPSRQPAPAETAWPVPATVSAVKSD